MSAEENVVVVTFNDDHFAYEAMTTLKELGTQGQIGVKEALVVARGEDGQLETKDSVGGTNLEDTAVGGIAGLLVGILAGPFGVLIGGATGLLIGSLFDIEDEEQTESALSEISRSVRVGHTALVADVTEPSDEVVDTAMERLGGSVLRRPLDDVEAEIAAAEAAQREARRQARKALLEARHKQHKQDIRAKVDELKAKLRPHRKVAA